MKLEYDKSVDSVYIKLDSSINQTSHAFTYCCNPIEVEGQIHLDFDDDNRLIGIEILQASKKLPLSLLE